MSAQGDIVARCGRGHRWTEIDLELAKHKGAVTRSVCGVDLKEHTYDCPFPGCGDSLTVYGEGQEILSEFEAQRRLGKEINRRSAEAVNKALSEASSSAGSATDSFKRMRENLSETTKKLKGTNESLDRLSKLVKPSGAFDADGARTFLRELQTTWAHLLPSDGGHAQPITRDEMRSILSNIAECVKDAQKGL